jgi:uncharacterized damage-inducible protein DinB
MARPQFGDFNSYAQTYVDATIGETVGELLINHSKAILDFIEVIPESKASFSYANGKWTVKQLLQHMIDTERIFVFRAVTFARKDAVLLAGFDENNYADAATAANRTLADLKLEFSLLRQSTDLFLLSLTEEDLAQKGIASNHTITVNAIAFIILGHNLHHLKILQDRYL